VYRYTVHVYRLLKVYDIIKFLYFYHEFYFIYIFRIIFGTEYILHTFHEQVRQMKPTA